MIQFSTKLIYCFDLWLSADPSCLMQEILSNICQKHGISCVKKLNYLNAFVHLINKNTDWKSPDTFGFSIDEILSWYVEFPKTTVEY